MDKQFNVIDLFSGCGGLSYGFQQAEYRISVALDNWDFALKTLKYNHSGVDIICDSISNVNPLNIKNEYNIDVIIGGPPCQGFSIAGKRIINDERNKLYKEFVKYVAVIRPKIFLMENVPNLASMGNGVILESILSDFNKIGYKLNWKILKASDYGVPQNRRRFFLIGTQNKIFDFNALSIYKTKEITSKEAISDLPEGDIKPEDGYPIHPLSEYQVEMRKESLGIYNHITTKHTEKTISIIKMVPDGGNYKNLPIYLQKTRNVNIAWTRLNSNKASFTIDTGHRHHFHYNYNRVPTVREAARIQSFPDRFIFYGNKSDQEKQVGNAVPPKLAMIIANEIKKLIG